MIHQSTDDLSFNGHSPAVQLPDPSLANPWHTLPATAPYVLPEDRPYIEVFNTKLPPMSPYRLHVETVLPEPFIGAVTSASVVVLQLNPGFDQATDPTSHADLQFRAALRANLQHEPTPWPFYFFDPRFRETHPGGRWWKSKTKKLAERIPLESLAQHLAVIEWFPYKSTRYKLGCTVPSQAYGFALVAAAMHRGALIVISRSIGLWESAVPALKSYPRKLTLSSVQNVALTPNNLQYAGEKTARAWDLFMTALQSA